MKSQNMSIPITINHLIQTELRNFLTKFEISKF